MYGSKNWGCAVPVEDSRLYRRGGRLSWRVVEASGSLWYSCKPGKKQVIDLSIIFTTLLIIRRYDCVYYMCTRVRLYLLYPGAAVFIIPKYSCIYYTG
jgi:hypothetical protein